MMLDEPFHFLHSREAHAKVAKLLKTVSDRLGLQIIMVTGEDESEEIVEEAGQVIEVRKVKHFCPAKPGLRLTVWNNTYY
jgi:ATP:corrinoid adenosyltransferase